MTLFKATEIGQGSNKVQEEIEAFTRNFKKSTQTRRNAAKN